MTDVPEAGYAPAWSADPRVAPPATAGERETLTAFLDWHRRTFALKCAGVPAARLSDKGVPPSGLGLHGLLRHLTAVERWWYGTTATPTSCASGSTAPRDTEMTTITAAAGAVPTGTGPADAASAAPARH
ncbi:DUF664 domain-containing protein [Actinoallomurus iriomotensis]|uniref:Mini-circle protein n=1 Tax=Actinoallomurus iriomotensis TaxID=478107 RepID=A0A9W6W638_9ACTN|nr:DUF664 domain-containing protein [Actinoallomurus iriomotensis]GLY92094.1 hypothetical protein Airi02_100220 [Actinoallomurus iriomotensis]